MPQVNEYSWFPFIFISSFLFLIFLLNSNFFSLTTMKEVNLGWFSFYFLI